jgi:enoyl-CoA hydratase/carnithine racemase
MSVVTIEREGHVLSIGVNRPDAYNMWNLEVIQAVSRAYRTLGDDPELRVGIVHGYGKGFTAGLRASIWRRSRPRSLPAA